MAWSLSITVASSPRREMARSGNHRERAGQPARDGALAACGTNTVENFQRAAQYVDRLLGGAKIADLPFDAPREVTLTINRRTARAIGLEIPPELLARADELIE